MSLNCCKNCENFFHCEKKWILGERGINSFCCLECKDFKICLVGNIKERWKIIHGNESNLKSLE